MRNDHLKVYRSRDVMENADETFAFFPAIFIAWHSSLDRFFCYGDYSSLSLLPVFHLSARRWLISVFGH